MNIVGSKWAFKAILKADGTLDKLKAKLVAKGYYQVDDIDYIETFCPVITPGTILLVLSLALVQQWNIKQLDVKNAFLHGYINEDIYMEQPLGMPNRKFLSHVCKLQKALYSLKQTQRPWFDSFSALFLLK